MEMVTTLVNIFFSAGDSAQSHTCEASASTATLFFNARLLNYYKKLELMIQVSWLAAEVSSSLSYTIKEIPK